MDAKEKEGTVEGEEIRKQIALAKTMFNKSSVSHNIITFNNRPATSGEVV
jgi:hypothetical protein